QQKLIQINTAKILFIFGGAFVGLPEIISKRVSSSAIGFNSDLPKEKSEVNGELLKQCMPEDLIRFGLIPEFIGRIPVITTLEQLTKDDLVRILQEPKNALVKQYKKTFSFEHCDLNFEKKALECIAEEAINHDNGARGLRAICERILQDAMYELPEKEGNTRITVKKDNVIGRSKIDIEVA
ncbi:MAG: AAA family ATPase, partial [Eggerthellaceae bacterium]|nr:AAA family ATPase [Eggerthellaceae bacterium]